MRHTDFHREREQNVHQAEKNDPRNYEQPTCRKCEDGHIHSDEMGQWCDNCEYDTRGSGLSVQPKRGTDMDKI